MKPIAFVSWGRQNNGPPRLLPSYSQVYVNMEPYMAEEIAGKLKLQVFKMEGLIDLCRCTQWKHRVFTNDSEWEAEGPDWDLKIRTADHRDGGRVRRIGMQEEEIGEGKWREESLKKGRTPRKITVLRTPISTKWHLVGASGLHSTE